MKQRVLDTPNPPRPAVDGQFRQPTDVTWDPEGNIFISDGYINSRVAKFDKNGDWVKQWGEPGKGTGQFDTPHSIAADARRKHLCSRSAATSAFRFRSRRSFYEMNTIDVPVRQAHPWMGRAASPDTEMPATARPGRSASRPAPTQYLIVPTPTPVAYTSCRWKGSRSRPVRANSRRSSAGSTKWPAPLKTSSTSRRS